MKQLPVPFVQRMKAMLGDDYEEFEKSYEKERVYGLRLNRLKITPEEFEALAPFPVEPIPWVENGYFYRPEDMPAKHPYYYAGLYYIQEPSAMTPASRLVVHPGERVLDLCAAPGGKATELGARLAGQGLLVANDISSSRMKALMKNVEVFGITNAFLTNEAPRRLAEVFPEFFDRILVDAPCSGEGMFRKEEALVETWDEQKPFRCHEMQQEILTEAVKMLRPGGTLLYSTCTFSPVENEQSVSEVLAAYPKLTLSDILPYEGFAFGNPAWGNGDEDLKKTVRIWPHRMPGEGHYLALFEKHGEKEAPPKPLPAVSAPLRDKGAKEALEEFFSRVRGPVADLPREIRGSFVYASPALPEGVRGLKFVRNGLLLGELKKGRFEPSQPLAMALRKEDYAATLDLKVSDDRVIRYLKGETLQVEPGECRVDKGWQLVCVDGYPLGWGKLVKGILKNKYLSGWRMN